MPTQPAPPPTSPPPTPTVLHVAQPTDGGVARVVTDLVRAQAGAGLRPVVLCPPDGPLPASAAAAGAEVREWPARRQPSFALRQETADVARAVRQTRPAVVHLHSAKAGLAGRLAVRGRVPTVFQPHAWSFHAVTGATAALALRWERQAARWCQRVLCVSQDERRRGIEAGIRARWSVVPNGIDTGAFPVVAAAGPEQRRLRSALPGGLREGGPLVVCVGRLCRQKGQDVLLQAWPEVTARVPGARLALVGAGPDDERLRAAAGPGPVFAGPTDSPAQWYGAADLVVLPSRWEGMALAPLEAMACSRPVVVSEVAGTRESLPPGQAPLCLVPPENPAALARAVVALLTAPDRRRALGEQAARHVRRAHDVRRTAGAVLRLYRGLVPELDTAAVPPRGPAGGDESDESDEAREFTTR